MGRTGPLSCIPALTQIFLPVLSLPLHITPILPLRTRQPIPSARSSLEYSSRSESEGTRTPTTSVLPCDIAHWTKGDNDVYMPFHAWPQTLLTVEEESTSFPIVIHHPGGFHTGKRPGHIARKDSTVFGPHPGNEGTWRRWYTDVTRGRRSKRQNVALIILASLTAYLCIHLSVNYSLASIKEAMTMTRYREGRLSDTPSFFRSYDQAPRRSIKTSWKSIPSSASKGGTVSSHTLSEKEIIASNFLEFERELPSLLVFLSASPLNSLSSVNDGMRPLIAEEILDFDVNAVDATESWDELEMVLTHGIARRVVIGRGNHP